MKIYLDESPPGSGKTYRAIKSIVDRKCKTIFSVEKIERFDELKSAISAMASQLGANPIVKAISSSAANRHGSVVKEVGQVFDDFHDDEHVIVLITHAALTSCSFENAHGWEIIVDEVPAMLNFEQKKTHLDLQFFQDHYQLEEFGPGWSLVTATEVGMNLTVSILKSCQSHSHLSQFHQKVLEASKTCASRSVLCNLLDWNEMATPSVQWCWASVFSFNELQFFDKVTLLGNCFRSDVGYKLSEKLPGHAIEWEMLPALMNSRNFHHRDATIYYFSNYREASKSLFSTCDGQNALREIGEHISAATQPNSMIWSANDNAESRGRDGVKRTTARSLLEQGGMISDYYLPPRQAGTNSHSSKTSAAMIYAAKPSPNLLSLLDFLKIDSEAWRASVEHEAILQFMTRTAIRDAGSRAPLTFWVFDRAQANYLKSSFDRMGYVTSSVELVQDGPVIPRESKRGPKSTERTPAEQREYDDQRRARDAARKRATRAKAKPSG